MAPLPVNNTYRVWCEYTSGDFAHDLLLRFDNDTPGNPGAFINDKLTALSNAMFGCMADTDAITGWRYSEPGSLISLPFDGPIGNGSQTGGTINAESRTGFYGISARSVGGRMYHANFFTLISYGESSYRVDYASLPSNLQGLFDAFASIGIEPGAPLVAIDGLGLVFKQYLNVGQNAYWQRAQR